MIPDWQDRAQAFGRVAELYDAARPAYPAAAVDHVLAHAPAGARDVVDLGCGTGKATVLFAARGCRVVGIEASSEMAEVARRNLPGSTVVATRVEDWEPAVDAADIVLSAQAWHWMDAAVAIPKVARVLRPGGVLAVMANVPRDGGMDLRPVLEPVYESIVPGLVGRTGMLNWDGMVDEARAALGGSRLFGLLDPWHVDWDQVLSADEYVRLMQTHSEYPLLPGDVLARLVDSVQDAIDAAGDRVTMHYRTMVTLARTPA